jgi:hypothetical protein
MPYRMYDVRKKEAWGVLGARRQNLPRLRVEKLGCASSPAGLVTLGLFVHPSNQSGAGASARLVATESTHSSYLCVAPPGQSPAYTYLKQRLKTLQIFNQKIWPCKRPLLAGKTFPFPKPGPSKL